MCVDVCAKVGRGGVCTRVCAYMYVCVCDQMLGGEGCARVYMYVCVRNC
jgi:hypothetical protein